MAVAVEAAVVVAVVVVVGWAAVGVAQVEAEALWAEEAQGAVPILYRAVADHQAVACEAVVEAADVAPLLALQAHVVIVVVAQDAERVIVQIDQ